MSSAAPLEILFWDVFLSSAGGLCAVVDAQGALVSLTFGECLTSGDGPLEPAFSVLERLPPGLRRQVRLERSAEALETVKAALLGYFAREVTHFDLPLRLEGTPFQREVWEALRRVPYGQGTTYQALATTLQRKGGARAVGSAVGANPVSVVVPCHRVLGSDGALRGYAWGLERKRLLLELEGLTFRE